MHVQGAEEKSEFFRPFKGLNRSSPALAQLIFLIVGFIIVLSGFLVLQSFIAGLAEDERSRAAQDFVEEIVKDFERLSAPLNTVADLIVLTDEPQMEDIEAILNQRSMNIGPYAQLLWFYKTSEDGWAFSSLWDTNAMEGLVKNTRLSANAEVLGVLLDQDILNSPDIRIVEGLIKAVPRQHRQSPKMISEPFFIAKAVEPGNAEKGVLLVMLDAVALYDESWIRAHRDVNYMSIRDVDSNMMVFEFDRNPEQTEQNTGGLQQSYEFPFAGKNLEVSGVFAQDQRSKFLGIFPYIVALFGFLLVGVGSFYLKNTRRQAEVLAQMNEQLERHGRELQEKVQECIELTQMIDATEQKGRAVMDAVSDVIFEVDPAGQIISLNRAWRSMTGFEIEQSIGKSLVQVLHPQDRAQIERDLKALLHEDIRDFRLFTQVRLHDGGFRAVELELKAVSHAAPQQSRFIGTITDIEERRRVERALSDAEKKYRGIVEHAAGGIFQLTTEGLYLSANPAMARILGYESPEQLLREVKNANEQLYANAGEREAFYAALMNSDDTQGHEVQMRRRDGKIIWVNESARAVADENGQFLFIEGSLEDITQRKESDLAIHQAKVHSDLANRAKSEFLSNMSHELRTPLNTIIGFSEMIQSEVYGKIEQRAYWEYARDIHESGQKLLQVINEILDISKIEAGERQLNEGVVNMRNVFESALQLLESKVDNSKLTITQSLDNVPDVIAEELALKQIVVNLLSNAVKFTPEKGRITISGHVHRDGRLHVSITDTGIGLNEHEIKKALSPFGQVNNNLSRSGSGTGLGLTLVDALIKLHGGEFELFSKKGIGTTATIILPQERIVKTPENKSEVKTINTLNS